MSKAVKDALKKIRDGERELDDALKRDYRPGAPIKWEYGGRVQYGVVVMNCYGDRIQVKNLATDAKPFIHAYRIV